MICLPHETVDQGAGPILLHFTRHWVSRSFSYPMFLPVDSIPRPVFDFPPNLNIIGFYIVTDIVQTQSICVELLINCNQSDFMQLRMQKMGPKRFEKVH